MPHLHWARIILVLVSLASLACGEINGRLSDDSSPTSHPYITYVAYLGNPAQSDETSHPIPDRQKTTLAIWSSLFSK